MKMENKYFITTDSVIEKRSYLNQPQMMPIQDIYTMGIDSGADIFSDIPLSLFSKSTGRQISSVMTKFKKEYIRYIYQKEINCVLPKLRYYEDEEGALVVQLASSWKSGNASLYFAFEKDEDESSFGMVWNDELKKNFESRSGSIVLNSIDEIIHEVLDFIFRVY
jgi:hypothetical protein